MAPEYLSTYCQPVSGISDRRHLRSADRGHLDFQRVRLASYGGRLFAYAGTGALKMTDMKLQDMKLTDRVAGHEIAGHENGGLNSRT